MEKRYHRPTTLSHRLPGKNYDGGDDGGDDDDGDDDGDDDDGDDDGDDDDDDIDGGGSGDLCRQECGAGGGAF